MLDRARSVRALPDSLVTATTAEKRLWDKPQSLDRVTAGLLAFTAAAVVYGGLYWLVHQPLLPVTRVEFTHPLQQVTARQVEDVVRNELRGNFLTLDLRQAQSAFARLPWARTATLQRVWPNTLRVTLEEHEALAVWQSGGLVNRQGELFQGATDAQLPVFSGPEDASAQVLETFLAVNQRLAPVGLHARAVHLSPRHALRVDLSDGPRIEMAPTGALTQLERFIGVYPDHIAALLPRISHIDLRYRNGFALRSRDGKPLPATPGTRNQTSTTGRA